MQVGILSRGSQLYSTQSLLEAGIARGHQMYLVDPLLCSIEVNTRFPAIQFNGQPWGALDAVIPRIGVSITQDGVSLIRQMESMGIYSLVSANALLLTRNKLHCLQWLATQGIPVPRTFQPTQADHLRNILEALGGAPVVIKLLESTHGVGVILAESEQNALAVGEAFFQLNQRFLVQEYIAESAGSDIRALVVGGRIVASMRRQAQAGEFRSNLHRGATAVPIALTGAEELIVRKTVKVLKLEVAGVDILRSNRGSLVMEVNASPGLEGIESVTHIDVAREIIFHVERSVRKLQSGR